MMKEMADCRRLMAKALEEGNDKELRAVVMRYLTLWLRAYPS